MPVVHRYTDGRGHYIKTRIDGSIITYQVAPHGEDYLRQKRYADGKRMPREELLWMHRQGYVYTHGSGPGTLDDPFRMQQAQRNSARRLNAAGRKKSGGRRQKARRKAAKKGCCSGVLLLLVGAFVLPPALFLGRRRR